MWISVDDRLPDADTEVLIFCDNQLMRAEYLYERKDFWGDDYYWYLTKYKPITHWQPLPEPPTN